EGIDYFLLPKEDEQSCGPIISPSVFLESRTSEDIRFLLEDVLAVPRLKHEKYWKEHVIFHLSSQEPDIKDKVIKELFKRWEIILDSRAALKTLSEIAFVVVTTSSTSLILKKPTEIFTPDKRQIKDLFFYDEPFFPIDKYLDHLPKLRKLGMKDTMTVDDVINRVIIFTSKRDIYQDSEIREKSLLLLKYIDDNYQTLKSTKSLPEKVLTETWIPVTNPDGQYAFSKASDCRDKLTSDLVSHRMPTVNYFVINEDLRKLFGWDIYPTIEEITEQLFKLLHELKIKEDVRDIKEYIEIIYKYLNKIVDNHIDFLKNKLAEKKWILNEDELYSTEALVFDLPNIIRGYKWFQVSDHNKNYYSQLLKKLGVKQKLNKQDYLEILQGLNFENNKFMVARILKLLSECGEDLKGLPIPNMRGQMIVYEKIFFNDINKINSVLIDRYSDILTHEVISSELAKALGIKSFNEDFLRKKMKTYDHEIFTTNFKDTLKVYDAGAKRFIIILDESDYRKNNNSKLFKEDMKRWQGPAIWIFNNEQFSDDDFNSIINSNCNKNPDKIGKRGLGFISCYNFTDLPQLISGNRVVFLDPLKELLPDNICIGSFDFHDYDSENVSHIFNVYKDQFEPYLMLNGNIFKLDFKDKEFKGTLFRLPLRTTKSKISNKTYKIDDIIKNTLDTIKNKIASELVFLRNIESIEVYRKRYPNIEAETLWKVEIKGNNPNRKFLGEILQGFQLDMQFTERNGSKNEKWIICSGKRFGLNYKNIPSSTWGGLPLNLHSNNWVLSPDKHSLDKNNALQNKNILVEVLPQLHVKLFEEYINCMNKKYNKQVISEFWPIPKNGDPQILQYGKKVLELVSQGTNEIFWSPSKGGSYVSFKHSCFINNSTPGNIITFLNEHGHSTVLLNPEHLKAFEDLSIIKPQRDDPQLIRNILKRNRFVLDPSNLILSFSILNYILNDERYEDLEGIFLVPLFENRFAEFARQKNYCIASLEQYELFPNTGPDHFISSDILKRERLYQKFTCTKFSIATKINLFGVESIEKFLIKELDNVYELDWNPNSPVIPNQKWLNEIWKYILNSPLEPFKSFPLLEVYNPNMPDSHKLVSLANSKSRPLLEFTNYSKEVQALTNIGIRFTKHQYNEKLKDYILKLEPDNILLAIEKYDCREKLLSDKESREILSQYFYKYLSLANINGYKNINVLKQLPIWPTHTRELGNTIYKSIYDYNAYLIPTKSDQSKPYTFYPLKKCNTYYYDTTNHPNMRKLLESLSAKKQSKINYIKDTIVPGMSIPQSMQDNYLKFLVDIFTDDDNINEIKNYVQELKIIPNKDFELFCAKDLVDQNNHLLRSVYDGSNRFLQISLQNNQKFVEMLKKIGFKSTITPDVFIECAEEIQANFKNENDQLKQKKIKKSAKAAISYFYDNQSELKPLKEKWNLLSKIEFIPISKKPLKVPYSYNCNNNGGELQSFENLCLSKYRNLAWTQLSFFKNEPNENVLKNYSDLGSPNIKTMINHLRTIQKTVSKSIEWKQNDKNGSLLFEAIKDIYEALDLQCVVNSDELLSCFPKDEPLFLNSTNPYDSQSWVVASHIDMNIQKDFSPKRRVAAEYLRKYEKLLILAEVGLFELPGWLKPEPVIENFRQLSRSIMKFLKAGNKTPFNNVLFRIKDQEIYANSSILVCVAPYFQELFFEPVTKFELTYEDIEPNSFRILLNWLYGESFSQAVRSNGDKKYDDKFFQTCKDLLFASKEFKLESLKELMEHELVKYILTDLVDDTLINVKGLAEEYKLNELFKYCEELENEMAKRSNLFIRFKNNNFILNENPVMKHCRNSIKYGKLYKESRNGKYYEERYIAFKDGILYCFKNERDVTIMERIKITKMFKVKIIDDKSNKNRFEIGNSTETYRFSALSKAEQTVWTDKIKQYINSLLDEEKNQLIKRKSEQRKETREFCQDESEMIYTNVVREFPDSLKAGKLLKESQILKRYEERYFIFHDGMLYYFKDAENRKYIKLEKTSKVKIVNKHRFEIETLSRTYRFCALSEEDQIEWCSQPLRKSKQQQTAYYLIDLPKSKPLPPLPSNTRTWTDRTGSFRVEAEFPQFVDDKVKLNGKKIAVPIDRMSKKNIAYPEEITEVKLDNKSNNNAWNFTNSTPALAPTSTVVPPPLPFPPAITPRPPLTPSSNSSHTKTSSDSLFNRQSFQDFLL
ncbi:4069_t:CDS:2, partial [Dentiscutata heterogama]